MTLTPVDSPVSGASSSLALSGSTLAANEGSKMEDWVGVAIVTVDVDLNVNDCCSIEVTRDVPGAFLRQRGFCSPNKLVRSQL